MIGLTIVAAAAALLGCEGPTEPRHTDVDFARATWLATSPSAYTYEVEIATSWFPKSGYYRVQVSNGKVVAATDSARTPVTTFTLTVDRIWDEILAARERNELNAAFFDRKGVPVESDMGPWPVDGGVHYSVRNFAANR